MGNLINPRRAAVLGASILGAAVTLPLLAQSGGSPVARYEMRASTVSEFGAMGSGSGAALRMALGGGGAPQAQHQLWLDLGSSRAATDGKPKADHFMPAGARLGKSVALTTPQPSPKATADYGDFQRPKGRMLIYWGCGEHAPKGQPVVIDFAKLTAGQVPPGLWSAVVPVELGVTQANSRTYGRWPSEDGKFVKADSSLVGAHRIAGNYSPEIAFNLSRDFMGALRGTAAAQSSGATLLSWNALPEATGYHASLIGGKTSPSGEMGDIVWWSSSVTREFGGGLTDWLSPGTVSRLVANRTVLGPQTTSCQVPAEVKRDAPDFMMSTLYAYGPEENFAYPPRPANAKGWNPEWTARIRHRSMTSFMIGGPDLNALAGDDGDSAAAPPPQCKPAKRRGLGGLAGAIGGAISGGVLGGGGGC